MTHISGFERSQLLLLPEAIDDYVVADNPVRFIDAFVAAKLLWEQSYASRARSGLWRNSHIDGEFLLRRF